MYDANGNTLTKSDSSGTTQYSFDFENRLTQAVVPGVGTTTFRYDPFGRRIQKSGAGWPGLWMSEATITVGAPSFRVLRERVGITDAEITHANNHTTQFAYNARGWVTQTTFHSTLQESYTYDLVGNLLSKRDRKNQTIQYVYDALYRLASKTYPDQSSVEYAYDLAGKVQQLSDPTGAYSFAYDNMGRLIGTTTQYAFLPGLNFQNAYTYDAASNRVSLTAPDNSITTYAYDTLNRLNGMANSWAGSFGFGYDALSRRTSLTRPNGVNTSYNYDSVSHLLSVLHQAGNTILDGASYTYDPAGNRTSKTNYLDGVTSNYGYDLLYQLTQVTQGGGTTESYSYDAVGNRLSSLGVPLYNYNSSNELTSNSNGSYTYDANGNTLSDPSGRSFTWDFENRLTQAVNPGVGTTTFRYDPFGRRIQKSGPLGTTNYLYDGANAIDEVDSTGTVLAKYAHGVAADEDLAMLRSGTASYYHQDGIGSITSLSSSTGAVAQTYAYDSFGKLTTSTGTLTNPFQYTGRELDSETGIYYYRARYFDPSAGRFLSEDRLRFDQGPNFYGYVRNNPLRWVDPTGNGTTCWSVTANGQMTQVPCANECLGNVCNVTPIGPPPPLLPPGNAWDNDIEIMNRIDKCLSEEIEEINQIETEAANSSFADLPWLPGKSLAIQGAESAAEHAGAEGLAHVIPYLDYLAFGWDIYSESKEYNEFKKKLKDAQQRRCQCVQDATK